MIIYKITNKINGKIYIGMSKYDLENKWKKDYLYHYKSTERIIHKAMAKYGIENFTIEQIDSGKTIEEVWEKEKDWIKFYKSNNKKYGYNIDGGGQIDGSWRERISSKEKELFSNTLSKQFQGRKRGKTTNKTSCFIGVCVSHGKYVGNLKYRQKHYNQRFSTEVEAAEAYDKMVVFFHGDGVLNFPEKLKEYKSTNWNEFWNMMNTKTFKRGVNKWKNGKKCKCGKRIGLNSKHCIKCRSETNEFKQSIKNKGKFKRFCPVSKTELHELIWSIPIRELYKIFNTCDYTIKRWLKEYNLNYPSCLYWNRVRVKKIIDYQI